MISVLSTRSSHTCDESKILTKPPARIFWSRNQSFPISSGVSCSWRRRGSYAAVGIEGASHHMLLRLNSEPFVSIGLLTMSKWCVELCVEGSISLLNSLCSSVSLSVCSSSLLQHSRFSSEIKSLIAGGKWHATKWSRTLWLLSKSSALSSCSLSPVGLKEKPICCKVSHNHVDSSSNSALKVIALLTLSIITTVSPSCLSSNLPAYLRVRSALGKIIPISGCCSFCFVVQMPPLHAKHLPPWPRCILWKSLSNFLTIPHCAHCLHLDRRVGFCHHPALSNSDSCCTLHQEPGKSRTGLFLSNLSASCQSERPCQAWILLAFSVAPHPFTWALNSTMTATPSLICASAICRTSLTFPTKLYSLVPIVWMLTATCSPSRFLITAAFLTGRLLSSSAVLYSVSSSIAFFSNS